MEPLHSGFFDLVICIEVSSMSFHGLIAHFFLTLNNISLSGCTTVYLSICQLKDILVASKFWQLWLSSVQFSHSVVSDSLWPHEPQHARSPCPSPTPGVHPSPCPLSQWCHPTISSSVVPFSSHLKSFPASGSFPMSQLFVSGGQSIGVSASTSVLPVNT